MPPRRDDSEVARLVSEQLMAALPNIVSQVAAGLNNNQNNNQGSRNRECTYKSFRSCNPKEFHGTDGAVGLLTWLESMESVLHISKCTEGKKVEFDACLLQGRALTWWNTQVQTQGREATNGLTWENFKRMMKEEYCPMSEIQKLEAELWNHEMRGNDINSYTARFHELAKMVPHLVTPEENRVDRYIWGLSLVIRGDVTSANPKTLQEAVSSATKLTNNAILSRMFVKDKASGKRKMEKPARRQSRGRMGKALKISGNYGIQTQSAEKEKRTYQRYEKCNKQHAGRCIICQKCNKGGHYAKDCRSTGRRACFECGSPDHCRNACPRWNQRPNTKQARPANQGNQGGPARGQVFEIGAEEARQNPDVVTGTFLLNNHYVSVLFDSGVDRSFVSLDFRPKINLRPQKLKEVYIIEYANGQECKATDVIMDCTLNFTSRDFRIDLIPIQLGSFDIIVGMDWLSKN
ncbi:uncharacterized protein LOC112505937 [Cynara cardunculus var. scolymus]|uniref:uncharacterized protein LOC112505937 n=1 Tax=Cynara cardunculus var. scolymus TaxID=59895 RepID=UPI000D625B5E|nr:uncharacterized protein LOC112505937 [Cynara cardunculus var. scolymus]